MQEARDAPKVIWLFWTGTNPLSPMHQLCLKAAQRNAGVEVKLISPQNLSDYSGDFPLHPSYEHLSLVHRADYLRCYFLHHFGGAYLDLDVICLKSLLPLWDKLKRPNVWAVGYRGMSDGEVICNSAFGPFRPGSSLTQEWHDAVWKTLEQNRTALEQHYVKSGGQLNIRGDLPGYPLAWQQLLADVLNPVQYKYAKHISPTMPFVVLVDRPLGVFRDRYSEKALARSMIGVAYLAGKGRDESVLQENSPVGRALRIALGIDAPIEQRWFDFDPLRSLHIGLIRVRLILKKIYKHLF